MNSNLPVGVQNTLLGFSDMGQHVYLLLMDKYNGWGSKENELKAFWAADRAERLAGDTFEKIINHMCTMPEYQKIATSSIEEAKEALALFMAKRHINNFL